MFILIIAGGYPQKESPLNGIFEFDQATALQSKGNKVVFVSIDLRSIRRKRKLGNYRSTLNNIEIFNYSLPLGPLPEKVLYYFGKIAIDKIFRAILKKHGRPDILHAHFSRTGNIAAYLKGKYDIPLVITEHSSLINKEIINQSIKGVAFKAYKSADAIISVSSALKEKLNSHFNINSLVVHNIVDIKIFKYKERSFKKDEFVFISIGGLNYNKGFDSLITAFKNAKFDKNVKLKIVGDGPLKQHLKNLINSENLSQQVEIVGFLPRQKIAELMKCCDAFVLASRSETFGVVYIEALSSGLPVIATKCGGPEDFINETNGMLVPVNNIISLTGALQRMVVNIDKYNRKSISDDCLYKFAPDTIANQLFQIYTQIINNQSDEQ